jgi:hypothetical protein
LRFAKSTLFTFVYSGNTNEAKRVTSLNVGPMQNHYLVCVGPFFVCLFNKQIIMKNQKIRDEFFAHSQEVIEFFADIKTEGVNPEEKESLKALLIDHATSCLFSILVYIDGDAEGKNVELVDVKTGKPIAENILHECYSNYLQSIK